MTYHAGIGPRLETLVGAIQFPTAPHVRCDGCGKLELGETKKGKMASWLRKGIAPRGWLLLRHENELVLFRRDYCKSCRVAVKLSGDGGKL